MGSPLQVCRERGAVRVFSDEFFYDGGRLTGGARSTSPRSSRAPSAAEGLMDLRLLRAAGIRLGINGDRKLKGIADLEAEGSLDAFEWLHLRGTSRRAGPRWTVEWPLELVANPSIVLAAGEGMRTIGEHRIICLPPYTAAMQYVVQLTHPPDSCPTANAKVRKLSTKMSADLPMLTKKLGVRVLAGPVVLGSTHESVLIVEADNIEAVNDLAMQSGLVQWNSVKISQGIPMEQALREADKLTPIY